MSIPKPADLTRWCDEILASWREIAEIAPDLILLAKMPTTQRDGHAAVRGGQLARGTSELTSVEAAADGRGFAGVDGVAPELHDWVLERLGELCAAVREARAVTKRAHGVATLIEHRGDMRYGRQATGGDCLACGRFVSGAVDDKLKRGYCTTKPGCYEAWRRFRDREIDAGRDPSPVVFRKQRLAQIADGAARSA